MHGMAKDFPILYKKDRQKVIDISPHAKSTGGLNNLLQRKAIKSFFLSINGHVISEWLNHEIP